MVLYGVYTTFLDISFMLNVFPSLHTIFKYMSSIKEDQASFDKGCFLNFKWIKP